MNELNGLPIENIDYIAGFDRLPEAGRADYENLSEEV